MRKTLKRYMSEGFQIWEIVRSLSKGFGLESDVKSFKKWAHSQEKKYGRYLTISELSEILGENLIEGA
jgi:hypothetical protein